MGQFFQAFLGAALIMVVTVALVGGGWFFLNPGTIETLPRPWELTTLEDRSVGPLSSDRGGSSSSSFECTYAYMGAPFADEYAARGIGTSSDYNAAIHSLSYWQDVAARDQANSDGPMYLNDVVQLAPNCGRVIIEIPVLTHQDRLDQIDWIDMTVSRAPNGMFAFVEINDVSRPGVEGAITFAQEMNLLAPDQGGSSDYGANERMILYVRMVLADF